jgi:adenine-specific DNA-methyltransferase
MAKGKKVRVGEPKGRLMLQWVGKRSLDRATAYPAQLMETFNPTGEQNEAQGLLFHGDNKDVLAWLLANGYRGKVDLIYIDPPFDSGADYVRRVQLRGEKVAAMKAEAHSLGEQIQYTDIWANDTYLQFIFERLLLMRQLLAEHGSMYLHSDWHRNHMLRTVADEVFGPSSLISEIVWKRASAKSNVQRKFPSIHDTLFFYALNPDLYCWNQQYSQYTRSHIEGFYKYAEGPSGEVITLEPGEEPPQGWRRFGSDNIVNPGYRPNLAYSYKGYPPPENGWKFEKEVMKRLDSEGRLIFPSSPSGRIRLKKYLDEMPGKIVQDLWDEREVGQISPAERLNFPTQKPEGLVERIVLTSSNQGDLVMDCFAGSGTTAAVAQKLGRRWIVADINKGAIQITSKRLQTVIQGQIDAGALPKQGQLIPGEEGEESPTPVALSFSVYKVNAYDLQVQHNEAVDLATELIGIRRVKTDTFFDGTLGRKLVKIIAFNHPLTPLDLQLVQDELKLRKDEERDVVVVCLGKELAADAWLEEYNRKRPINKIEVIELRTDQKYGKFFMHQPAQAQVSIKRKKGKVLVEIEDFISPTIAERLEIDIPIFKAQIPDWRAMVDVVLIDAAYDGEVFNITLSDVPEKKNDLVVGSYELEAPDGKTTVAVKIIDMLGEEVLVVEEV